MFTATFREIQTHGEGGLVAVPGVWSTIIVPPDTPKTLNKAKDRVVYNLALPAPVSVPSKATCVLVFLGETVLVCKYGAAVGVPTLRPGGDPETLPAEKWVQLNPAADDFVIQLKLQKRAPDGAGDPGTGEQYVYDATRFVVQASLSRAMARPTAAPATDIDRALLI